MFPPVVVNHPLSVDNTSDFGTSITPIAYGSHSRSREPSHSGACDYDAERACCDFSVDIHSFSFSVFGGGMLHLFSNIGSCLWRNVFLP